MVVLATLLVLQAWCLWLAQYSVTILLYVIGVAGFFALGALPYTAFVYEV